MKSFAYCCTIACALLLSLLAPAQALAYDGQSGQYAGVDDEALGQEADGLDLQYTVTIDDPSSHLVHIELALTPVPTGTLRLARRKITPLPSVLDLAVVDQDHNPVSYSVDTSLSQVEVLEVSASTSLSLTVSYDVDLSYTDNGSGYSFWVLDHSYGLVDSRLIFYQPVTDIPTSSASIGFDLPEGWNAITRFRSGNGVHQPDPQDVVVVSEKGTEYPFFIWTSMGFGNFDVYERTVGGINVLTAFHSDDDALERERAEGIFDVVDYASSTLGILPDGTAHPRLIYLFHDWTHGHVHGGDHLLGQLSVHDEELTHRWRGQAHLIFHNWFVGGFELPMWHTFHIKGMFGEGTIQYYALESARVTGLWDTSEVNDHLCSWYSDYVTYIQGTEYDIPVDSPEWVSLPNDPLPSLYNYGIRFIIWYEKAPLLLHLLNWKIEDVTNGSSSVDDVWRLLLDKRPGNPWFKGHELDAYDILETTNRVTGRDFTDFFDTYFFGTEALPFEIVDGALTVDSPSVSGTPPLTNVDLVRLSLHWDENPADADDDGLADDVEDQIGTHASASDTDQDGVGDRGEFGVVIDGRGGEYSLDKPLTEDAKGDSALPESGMDIREVHAKIFVDEDGVEHLYLVLSTWIEEYNPEVWYEFLLTTNRDFYQYRFMLGHRSELYHEENGDVVPVSADGIDAAFDSRLEVKIPMEMLGNPDRIALQGTTFTADERVKIDSTSSASLSVAPEIFITDPVNPDTDGDGAGDGVELRFGTDPTDAADTPWSVWLPMILRTH